MTDAAAVETEESSAPFFAMELTKRQKLTRRIMRLTAALAVVVVMAAGIQLWRAAPATADQPPVQRAIALPVSTLIAQHVQSYSRQRTYTGVLREARRSKLSFQRGGELLELSVDEGQVVEAGQLLGRLDARHIRALRMQLEAQVAEAKAVLEERMAGPREESIAAKRAELRAQQSQRQVLSGQLARRKQLLLSSSVSREEYETFLYDYEAAVAREDVVERQLDEMLAGTRVEKIAAQRARLAQLDAQLTDLAHDLQDTKLVAPFAGRVSQRFMDEGTVILAGTPVLEVIDDTQLEAWIGLPPTAALTLQVGQQRELSIAGVPLQATVQSLAPDVQQSTRTRNVILRLQSRKPAVLPGQVVRLAVTEEVAQAGYWVPTTALTRGTRGLWSVYVVRNGVARNSDVRNSLSGNLPNSPDRSETANIIGRCDVELLDTVGGDSFVRGTLQPGDAIVASGTHRIVLGQQVTVQNESLARNDD